MSSNPSRSPLRRIAEFLADKLGVQATPQDEPPDELALEQLSQRLEDAQAFTRLRIGLVLRELAEHQKGN